MSERDATQQHATNVIVSLRVAGVHSWPDCPFEEVKHLRNPHRHVFHIRAEKKVNHDDRDVEIIKLKNDISQSLSQLFNRYSESEPDLNFETMSCEQIAEMIARYFDLSACEVLEDGENGARVEMYYELPF